MTKQQKILFKILNFEEELNLGDIRVKFYGIHTPKINHGYHNEMRRNSRMSAWLNSLELKGLVYIDRYDVDNLKYSLTDKGKNLLMK